MKAGKYKSILCVDVLVFFGDHYNEKYNKFEGIFFCSHYYRYRTLILFKYSFTLSGNVGPF